MGKKKIEEIVEDLALPIIKKNNFELVDIEFKKEGSDWFLRLYIDKEGGITLDDCQVISEYLSDQLDEIDPIEQSYILEVSSPGINRPLKKIQDFETFKNHDIDIKLYAPLNGRKKYMGKLKGLVENRILIEENEKIVEIPLKSAAS